VYIRCLCTLSCPSTTHIRRRIGFYLIFRRTENCTGCGPRRGLADVDGEEEEVAVVDCFKDEGDLTAAAAADGRRKFNGGKIIIYNLYIIQSIILVHTLYSHTA